MANITWSRPWQAPPPEITWTPGVDETPTLVGICGKRHAVIRDNGTAYEIEIHGPIKVNYRLRLALGATLEQARAMAANLLATSARVVTTKHQR